MSTEQTRPPAPANRITNALAADLADNEAFTSRYLPWQPSTAYTAGTFLSYGGKLYTVDADFTSPSTFSSTGLTSYSAQFAPVADSVFISAGAFGSRTGSANLSSVFNGTAWYLDGAADEIVGANVIVPPSWATYRVDGYFVTLGGTGDFVVGARVDHAAAGSVITSSAPTAGATLATATTGTVRVATLIASVTVAAGVGSLNVARLGTAAGDTLTNDVGFLGVDLVRLTSTA